MKSACTLEQNSNIAHFIPILQILHKIAVHGKIENCTKQKLLIGVQIINCPNIKHTIQMQKSAVPNITIYATKYGKLSNTKIISIIWSNIITLHTDCITYRTLLIQILLLLLVMGFYILHHSRPTLFHQF